ncbi:MAG: hypothetical protein KAY59_04905, partial [Acidobacteria bacterium]|nr:hypothetical protein [Acidobacteriota bacterium]
MTSRPGRLRLLTILICLSFPLASGSLAGQSGGARPAGNPAQVWTGTVTVETRGSGPMMPSGEGSKIRFVGSESVTYSLRGDGTAGWTATASNTTDMAGLATIPMRGSGSGHGRGSVTFNGQSWDIAVESEDEYPTSTDLTAWDKVFAEGVFGWAIAMAQAMGHQLPSGDHVEEGRMDPSGADVSAAGAATASTLSGSQRYETESTHIGGFNGVSATVTVTWNLRRGPVPPSVRIYGPECGCMTNDDTEKSLHFIAGATPEGGEFSEFVVTSTGKMPEIISNNGGDQPSLDLVGTKDTGEVTLKITYTQN